jgi:hypothetical protein
MMAVDNGRMMNHCAHLFSLKSKKCGGKRNAFRRTFVISTDKRSLCVLVKDRELPWPRL